MSSYYRPLARMLPFLVLGLVAGCVEQEPDRPTEDDKRIIRQNILKKVPKLKHTVNADLEGKVTYLGLDVDKDVIQPGEQFTLTHYWKVHKKVDGWRLFVHLNGPGKRGFINADHKPIGGRYPVSRWKPGQIIRDEHKVTLPGDYKDDKVMVFAGLWKGKLRMKIKGPQDEENRILCATLPVGRGPSKPAPRAKRIVAIKAAKPITIDGKLDEEVWAKAPSTGPFVNTLSAAQVPVRTEAKFAWDDKRLYVAFDCADEDIWTTLKKRDDKLWTQEVVELFIDANGDGKDYVELQVNPAGTIFDSYLPQYRKNQNDWNSKLESAVKLDGTLNKREDGDKGWTVEIGIPWADVKGRGTYELELPPAVGTEFKVNLFRLDHPKGKPPIAAAWSPPMVGDFHKLDRFGVLVFGDEQGEAPESKKAGPVKKAAAKDERLPPGVVRMKAPDTKTIWGRAAKRMPLPRKPPKKPAK